MNIRDLKYLVAVHDLNNFSKAAERCFVSQPTLSGQLKKLEQELGSSLIERSTRQVLFTPLGNEVVSHAREVLYVVDRIRRVAKEGDDPMVGEFHIGLIPTVGPFLLPIIMPQLSAAYPDAKLFLYEHKTEILVDKLTRGELDAAFVANADWSAPVLARALYRESLKLAVSDKDPLANGKTDIQGAELQGRPVLMLEDGHCLRDQAIGVCCAAGADEDKRFQATSMDTLLHMVAAGAGFTIIPDLATRTKAPNIEFLSFSDPEPSREIVMLMRKNSSRARALNHIADVVEVAVNEVMQEAPCKELVD